MRDYSIPPDRRLETTCSRTYCSVCQRLINQARSSLFKDVVNLLTDNGYIHNNIWGANCSLCPKLRNMAGIKEEQRHKRKKRDTLVLQAFAKEVDPAAIHFPRRPVKTDVSDDATFQALKQKLKECQEEHSACGTFPDKPVLSRRVVRVGNQSDDRFNIYESTPLDQDDYVALSYCWGQRPTFVATTHNIDSLKAGLPVTILPQTIQDAIEVTRRLGYKYLWVDALCILQDSPVDKERDIPYMGRIYRSATVTIAAAVASSSHEGFLRVPRSPPPFVEIPFPLGQHGEGNICLVVKPKPVDINQLPLGRRGWVFQEFFLSKRILIYTKHEVVWFCNQSRLIKPLSYSVLEYLNTINQLEDIDRIRLGSQKGVKAPDYQSYQHLPNFKDEPDEADWENEDRDRKPAADDATHSATEAVYRYKLQCRIWKSIVTQYTARSLTNLDDRPHALQGVAEHLQHSLQTEYAFGTWTNAWPELLIWVRSGPVGPYERRWHRAPSWSWISVDFAVQWRDHYQDLTMNVYEVEGGQFGARDVVGIRGQTSFWSIPTLSFQGRVIPLELIEKFRDDSFSSSERTLLDFEDEPSSIRFAILLGRTRFDKDYCDTTIVCFLIVSKLAGALEIVYQRMGVGEALFDWKSFRTLTQQHPKQEVCLC